jgi:dTDP-4-amino-4,6-dideoxygalactose transaminase
MEPKPILANDFGRQWSELRADLMATFEKVGESGWYVLGDEVVNFEKALAEYWNLPYVVGVASGLDALEISLRLLGCKAGDRVLTTPLSAFATTMAIVRLGAIPVYVDCDRYGLLSLDEAESLFTRRTEIRQWVPVHLYGHALNSDRMASLQGRFELKTVEDCAQSIGARFHDKPTGATGQLAATSFYPTKNLGAFGDGGAILTSDPDLADRARQLRDYGQSAKYIHQHIGYNSRLDELQAALLAHVMLPRLDGWLNRRRAIAKVYLAELKNSFVTPLGAPEGSQSAWHLFPVSVAPERKTDFLRHLKGHHVMAGEHYPAIIPDQPAMADVPHEIIGDLTNARRLAASEVSLPIHPFLTYSEVARVIETVNRWCA